MKVIKEYKATAELFTEYKEYLFWNCLEDKYGQKFLFVYENDILIAIALYTEYSKKFVEELLIYDNDFECSVYEEDREKFAKQVEGMDYLNCIYSLVENKGGAKAILEYLNKKNTRGAFMYSVLEAEEKWTHIGCDNDIYPHIYFSKKLTQNVNSK